MMWMGACKHQDTSSRIPYTWGVAAKRSTLKASERRIVNAAAAEVYKRLSREIGTKLERGELIVLTAGSGKPALAVKTALDKGTPLLARAIDVFGSKQVAIRWFHRRNPALRMNTPLDAVISARGRKELEAILGRIEQGVIS